MSEFEKLGGEYIRGEKIKKGRKERKKGGEKRGR